MENIEPEVFVKHLHIINPSREFTISHNFKICIVSGGWGLWQIGGREYYVSKGDIVILYNRERRMLTKVCAKKGISLIVLEFDPGLILNTRFIGLFLKDDREDKRIIPSDGQLEKILGDINDELENKQINYKIILQAKLVEVLCLVGRSCGAEYSESFKLSSGMCRVLEYIDENYCIDISQQHAAGIVNMSPTAFSKYFKRQIKVGFAQYVMMRRVQRAVYLLESGNKTVLEISLDCGFNNLAAFYKAFKKITRKIPREFRNGNGSLYI